MPARMPQSPAEAFAAALIKAAIADKDGVARLVGKQCFDDVPADIARAQPPYVYLGPANIVRVESDCSQEWDVRQRLFVASVASGRYQAWEIAQLIIDRFDRRDDLALIVPYGLNSIIRAFQGGDVVEPANPKLVFVDLSATVLKGE